MNATLVQQWDQFPETVAAPAVDHLPAIENAAELIAETLPHPTELIHGVLHMGSKLILGSSSKARKTWVLLDMALSVSTGLPFWKWQTTKGRVLYINFEIQKAFLRSRIQTVAAPRNHGAHRPRLRVGHH
jgi:RecA-family ATPase